MARMAPPDELNWVQNSLAGDTEAFGSLDNFTTCNSRRFGQ